MQRLKSCPARFRITPIAMLTAGCAAWLASIGCETTETASRGADRPSTIQQQPETEPDQPETTSELASIAERDVQAFLDRRAHSTPARERQPEQPTRDQREILWNLPDEPKRNEIEPIDLGVPDLRSSELFLLPDDDDEVGAPESEPDEVELKNEDDLEIDRDRIRELIVELSKDLYREATYADMPLRELMLIAATTMVTPDRALQPEAIPALTERERELLGEFQSFFTQIGQQLDGSRTADEVLTHALDELRAALTTKPQLHLETMALCTRVGGFGDYDTFDRYSFLAHAKQQAVLYLELVGFTSELNQQNQWATELSLQLMIYSDRDGIPVWREDWQTAVDVSRNKRQDFFMVQVMTLPQALSVGKYHLKVRARDEKSGAEAEGSIPFEMVADPKLAAGAER